MGRKQDFNSSWETQILFQFPAIPWETQYYFNSRDTNKISIPGTQIRFQFPEIPWETQYYQFPGRKQDFNSGTQIRFQFPEIPWETQYQFPGRKRDFNSRDTNNISIPWDSMRDTILFQFPRRKQLTCVRKLKSLVCEGIETLLASQEISQIDQLKKGIEIMYLM